MEKRPGPLELGDSLLLMNKRKPSKKDLGTLFFSFSFSFFFFLFSFFFFLFSFSHLFYFYYRELLEQHKNDKRVWVADLPGTEEILTPDDVVELQMAGLLR